MIITKLILKPFKVLTNTMNKTLAIAGTILAITVLATSSFVPGAYATANILDWTVTLTNTNNEKSFSWNSVDTGIGDCLSGSDECIIPLTEGKLKKCINETTDSGKFIVWNPYVHGQQPPIPRKFPIHRPYPDGSWSVLP